MRLREQIDESVDSLHGGLCARIYLAAYPKWLTCYEIAKKVFPKVETRNVAGKVSKVVSINRELFDTKLEKVGEFKMRTLVRSRHEPLLKIISERCELTPEEERVLAIYLNSKFRDALDVYIEETLRRSPDYLRGDLDAFNELAANLAFLFSISRIYNDYGSDAKEFIQRLAELAMPSMFGGKHYGPLEDVAQIIPAETLSRVYNKIRPIVPIECQPLLCFLDGFANYLNEVRENPEIAKSILTLLLNSWRSLELR